VAEVTIHPEAEAEYEHAFAWYLDRSPQAARRFETAFDEAIEAVRSYPTTFPLCDDIHRFVLLKRYPYSLVYR
jgi:plasmid stabilization system protein ParE